MVFELLTGDFLFDPKKSQNMKKSEDHLALMMELLNLFPKDFSTVGANSKHFIEISGRLKKIHNLNFLSLRDLFVKFQNMKHAEANALADFLSPMLRVNPWDRASAREMLDHYWLEMETTELFATPEELLATPEAYDKTQLDRSSFHRVVDPEEFNAEGSVISSDGEEFMEDEP